MRSTIFKTTILIVVLHFSPLLWRGAGGEVCAQQQQVDSLKKLLVEYNDGHEKELQLLNAIVPLQVNIKPNDALANADKAIALAQKLNNQKELASAYNNTGFILLRKSQFVDAKLFLKKALVINTTLQNQIGICDNQIILAEVLRRLGETDSAEWMLQNVLKICQSRKYTKGIGDANFGLAEVNRDLSDFDKVLEFTERAIGIFRQINDESKLALAINTKSGYYYYTSDYENALKYARESMQLNQMIGNLYGLANNYYNLGHIYSEFSDLPKALDNHLKSLRFYEQILNEQMQANLKVNIGLDYWELKQYDKALRFTSEGIKQMDALKINNGQYRMSIVYMGIFYLEMGNVQKSFEFTNRAIKLCLAANDEWALSDAYDWQGNAYMKLKQYDDALRNFQKALAVGRKLEVPSSIAIYCIGVGRAIALASDTELIRAGYLPSDRSKLVVDYFKETLKIGLETNNKISQRDALEQLSLFYEKLGDEKKSFEYYKQYIAYKDSTLDTDKANTIALLQIQYDTEKKEQQIALLTKDSKLQQAELQKQNTTRNSFIAGLILVSMLALISFNRYRVKHKANNEIEKTLAHLKNTQEQLIEREKLASLGKLTLEVAKQMEVPVTQINQLNIKNSNLMNHLKNNVTPFSNNNLEELKNNLKQIYTYGKEADSIVKKVLTETRKTQG